ncbi:MAG: archaeal proteasome endopeptidase complex subunit alpha [Candidatus Lokiarchaeota archaeon]|nr:archaeal proteasome endopeptidase complex subunit alpha [Candidatus Lokiarchaeota archaeon]
MIRNCQDSPFEVLTFDLQLMTYGGIYTVFGISGRGYDMSTSVFSPDGRIFAAEYAKKAVEQGATSIGILCKDGVVLLAEKKLMPLQEPDSVEKISKIDSHIAVATSGLMADARYLIREARTHTQSYWLSYDEPITAEALADFICEVKAARLSIALELPDYSQLPPGRPFGVAMIISSVDFDDSPQLIVTDPVGTSWGYMATVIGRGSSRAGAYLEEHYKPSVTVSKGVELALAALRETGNTELTPENVEIAKIPVKTKEFERLTHDEIKALLESGTE